MSQRILRKRKRIRSTRTRKRRNTTEAGNEEAKKRKEQISHLLEMLALILQKDLIHNITRQQREMPGPTPQSGQSTTSTKVALRGIARTRTATTKSQTSTSRKSTRISTPKKKPRSGILGRIRSRRKTKKQKATRLF